MRLSFFIIVPLLALSIGCTKKSQPGTTPLLSSPPATVKEWKFEDTPSWADEFSAEGKPDGARWGYDTGGSGWGNNELQYYTPGDNITIKNGVLLIEARKEEKEGRKYTSTRLVSKGKGDFLYGRFEARAKLPKGRGLWPAIWMLPTDWEYGGWPRSGEIDIMEQVGYDPFKIHMTVHTESYNHVKGTQKSGFAIVPSATDAFHLYRVDWTPDRIQGYIDNNLVFTFENERRTANEWPFDKKFHWLLNVAVGGNWGGAQGVDDTIFPALLEIDFVRVYKLVQ
jgi:beta-glucanase (GH16 family)